MPIKLSLIIPVFNAATTLPRTLSSLECIPPASRAAVEIVIVNDGSTDHGMEAVAEARDRLAPMTCRQLDQPNRGSGAARNAALQACTGQWVLFLDADDELTIDPVPFLSRYPTVSALAFRTLLVRAGHIEATRRPARVTVQNHRRVFTAGNPYAISAVLFRKDRLRTPFPESFAFLEDWLFWIRNPLIFEDLVPFRHRVSCRIHAHGGNKSADTTRHGHYRELAAESLLADSSINWSNVERNNLRIQAEIGRLQQGRGFRAGMLLHLPCNLLLYGKLLLYCVNTRWRVRRIRLFEPAKRT